MKDKIDLTEIDIEKYKNKCLLIKKGKCRNVNLFLQEADKKKRLKQCIMDISNIIVNCNDITNKNIFNAIVSSIQNVSDILGE